MIQQAYREGFNPIYLVGCDLGFKGVQEGEDDVDHFHPDYNRRLREPERAVIDQATHIDFHAHAQRYLSQRGVRLINATEGGELEVHPRAAYETLFR